MFKNDKTALIQLSDVPAAIGLLTRLPVPVDGEVASARGAAAAWAYPIAGLLVACLAALVGSLTLWIGIPSQLVAVLALTTLVVITGALHEDGLADSADGLWGGWTKERRLEIMKDSRIGAYGVIALVLSLTFRGAALNGLIAAGLLWPALIICAVASRCAMVVLMSAMPNARDTGLSQSVGRPPAQTAILAFGLTVICVLVLSGWAGLWVIMAAAVATLLCGLLANAKIGGQTGDILGATGQIVEMTLLLVLILTVI